MYLNYDLRSGEIIDTICVSCDLPTRTNDVGLCRSCAAKLVRDLIRNRDWDYSITAFGTEREKLKALRERVIQEYGAKYELILPPGTPLKTPRKNKRSHSRASQRKAQIAVAAIRDYGTDDVLQAAQDFLRDQKDEWVNSSLLSQYLYERFYKLIPKHLGVPGKKHKSLLKFIMDYPSDFVVRKDEEKLDVYWNCFVSKAKKL